MNHTEGKLTARGDEVCDSSGNALWDYHGKSQEENEANARRLVACWNAFEGVPTEAIEKSASTGPVTVIEGFLQQDPSTIPTADEHNALLVEQIEELREALESFAQENSSLKAEIDRLRRVKDEPLERAIQEKETFRAKRNKK